VVYRPSKVTAVGDIPMAGYQELTEVDNSFRLIDFLLSWRQYSTENPSGKLDETTPMTTLSPLPKSSEESPFLTRLGVSYGRSKSFAHSERVHSTPILSPQRKSVAPGDLRRTALTNVHRLNVESGTSAGSASGLLHRDATETSQGMWEK